MVEGISEKPFHYSQLHGGTKTAHVKSADSNVDIDVKIFRVLNFCRLQKPLKSFNNKNFLIYGIHQSVCSVCLVQHGQ